MHDLYDRFIGSWDVESSAAGPGEWHFWPILGGRAIQDVIYRVGAPESHHGTTVRSYDPAHGHWWLFYTCPGDREYVLLEGRPEGDRIVQLGHDLGDPESLLRWTFSDVTDASFTWRGERSPDGGATWRLTHEMRSVRRAS